MITAVDTNVIVGLWAGEPAARRVLEETAARSTLMIAAPVFCELVACPGRNESFVANFCAATGIRVDWEIDEPLWRAAARAFQLYATRRRAQKSPAGPRRSLAGFLIGAHAAQRAGRLLTLDDGIFRAAFPRLILISGSV